MDTNDKPVKHLEDAENSDKSKGNTPLEKPKNPRKPASELTFAELIARAEAENPLPHTTRNNSY